MGNILWEYKFTSDAILDAFLIKLSEKGNLYVNPISRRELIYKDRASLEFSTFNNQGRKEISLQDIAVFDKGQGIGKEVMQDIIDVADELKYKLTLDAQQFGSGGLSTPQLVDFYKKFGFVIDLENAYGGEFGSDEEIIKYVKKYKDESVPMYRNYK